MVNKTWTAIGLMSGTSMDGVDAAVITTDGEMLLEPGAHLTMPYDRDFRERLRNLVSGKGDLESVEDELTTYHARAVTVLLRSAGMNAKEIDVIGFHGHTILHNPEDGHTWQIGDGAKLAAKTRVNVVYDLRAAVFHRALSGQMSRPLAVLNIGGVANLTWIGGGDNDLMGFDTGPGNALIDDWIMRNTGAAFDQDGMLAAAGRASPVKLAKLMTHPYFKQQPPKSLDRDDFVSFAAEVLQSQSTENGAALLTAFTVESIAHAVNHLPLPPSQWIIVGGGRHNQALMTRLRTRMDAEILCADDIGWSGDAVEAQAFGYMAVRSRLGLPISYPGTTGVPHAMSGGVFTPKP
jgi:anhydro-N-acetylmuramic acid kinase